MPRVQPVKLIRTEGGILRFRKPINWFGRTSCGWCAAAAVSRLSDGRLSAGCLSVGDSDSSLSSFRLAISRLSSPRPIARGIACHQRQSRSQRPVVLYGTAVGGRRLTGCCLIVARSSAAFGLPVLLDELPLVVILYLLLILLSVGQLIAPEAHPHRVHTKLDESRSAFRVLGHSERHAIHRRRIQHVGLLWRHVQRRRGGFRPATHLASGSKGLGDSSFGWFPN